jgi:hypothetical protein
VPVPEPGQVPGVAFVQGPNGGPALDVLYRTTGNRLVLRRDNSTVDLGGVLTSGAGVVVRASTGFAYDQETVYARGGDGAIWFRHSPGDITNWQPWSTIGGQALGAPTATCAGDDADLRLVYVRGTDGRLWRSIEGNRFSLIGGHLLSDPSAVPAVGGSCPAGETVFALGTDHAVWEWSGGWRRVGGRSTVAPAAVRRPDGTSVIFVRGTDDALWRATRPAGSTTWSGFRRVGGILTGPPATTALVAEPIILVVQVLGADGNLWRGSDLDLDLATWTWRQAP